MQILYQLKIQAINRNQTYLITLQAKAIWEFLKLILEKKEIKKWKELEVLSQEERHL